MIQQRYIGTDKRLQGKTALVRFGVKRAERRQHLVAQFDCFHLRDRDGTDVSHHWHLFPYALFESINLKDYMWNCPWAYGFTLFRTKRTLLKQMRYMEMELPVWQWCELIHDSVENINWSQHHIVVYGKGTFLLDLYFSDPRTGLTIKEMKVAAYYIDWLKRI